MTIVRSTLSALIGVAAVSLAACGQPAEDEASVPVAPAPAETGMDPQTNDVAADTAPSETPPPTAGAEPQINPGPVDPPPTLPVEPAPPSTSPAPK